MRKNPLKTAKDQRLAAHALGTLATEISVLMEDGMPPRLVCIALLMTACRLAGQTDAVTPRELDRLFHLALTNYVEEDGA